MAHHSRLYKAVIDVPEDVHAAELAFWEGATGQELSRLDLFPEFHGAALPGQEFALLVQQLGSGASRVHLDIHTDDLTAEVARLERLGATRVAQAPRWWVMRDPAGLPFCVIAVRPGSLTEANAHRWE